MYYLNTASGAGCYCAVDFCGCRIVEVVEYGEQTGDEQWLKKMPAHLLIVGQKEGSA